MQKTFWYFANKERSGKKGINSWYKNKNTHTHNKGGKGCLKIGKFSGVIVPTWYVHVEGTCGARHFEDVCILSV